MHKYTHVHKPANPWSHVWTHNVTFGDVCSRSAVSQHLSLSSSAFRLSVRTYSKHVKMPPPNHHHQSPRQIKRAGQGGCFAAASKDASKDEAFPLTWRLACTAALLVWRLKNNMSAPQSPVPLPHSPSPPGKQNNKAGDDTDKDYLGMEKPTHLLVHHTVCTVILNRDQRETTGD